MKNRDYHSSITAHITPKEAFDKIARVSEWWTSIVEGKARHLNDVFTVRLGGTFETFKVVEIVPNKRIVWEVVDSYHGWLENTREWIGTKIVWEISPQKDTTQIDITHVGLTPHLECYTDCKRGWDGYIKKSLFTFLTEGKGKPDEF